MLIFPSLYSNSYFIKSPPKNKSPSCTCSSDDDHSTVCPLVVHTITTTTATQRITTCPLMYIRCAQLQAASGRPWDSACCGMLPVQWPQLVTNSGSLPCARVIHCATTTKTTTTVWCRSNISTRGRANLVITVSLNSLESRIIFPAPALGEHLAFAKWLTTAPRLPPQHPPVPTAEYDSNEMLLLLLYRDLRAKGRGDGRGHHI